MKRVLKFINRLIPFILFCIFVYLVLTNSNMHIYNSDELYAYVIAKQFGFVDIIRLMRAEGHTFIWYYILKLIPQADWCFPSALKCLSACFSFIAMGLLLFKSPFNNLVKVLITFTSPILLIYPILARPYSLGIMLLFVLTLLYKKRLEHPIWFASLIFITANTSLMAAVGAFSFGLVFLYDLIKTKNKSGYIAISILALCALILFLQWHNPIIPQYSTKFWLRKFLFDDYKEINYLNIFKRISRVVIPCFMVFSVLYLKNNLRNLFLFLSNTLLLIGIFYYVYGGYSYHYHFVYIYWVIAYWIQLEKKENLNYYLPSITCFILINILFLFCIKPVGFWFSEYIRNPKIIQELNNIVPHNGTVYTSFFHHNTLYLYKEQINFKLKNYIGNDLFSYDSYLNIYNFKKVHNIDLERIKTESPKDTYLWLQEKELEHYPELSSMKPYFIYSTSLIYKIN